MNEKLSGVQLELLRAGLDDWVDAGIATELAAGFVEDPAERMALALSAVTSLVENDLMDPGEVTGRGFMPWLEDSSSAIQRIRSAWVLDPHPLFPRPGAVVWLQNTEAGDEIARGLG